MTPEEAKEYVATQNARLRALETEVTRLASTQPTPCAAQGPHLSTHNKTKFYESVILMLRESGISQPCENAEPPDPFQIEVPT